MQESNPLRSVAAIIVGFLAVVVLSLGTDQLLHILKVYPPWGDPMPQPGLNALALSYRIVFTIFGSYLAARIAPRNPMRHAMILGLIGTVFGTAGAVATIPMHLGPAWYPIAIAATALPCAWIGGKMAAR
ncbi:MAG: hypothetical protein QOE26_2272 [Verrucomicrobiota bacterium]|jgi:hypothetical protein